MTIISARNLTKVFQTGDETLTVLNNADLEVQEGETLAVVGRSGSGKSTLLALLAGLDAPTSGKVIALNQDLSAMDEDECDNFRARNMGFVFQSYHLIPSLTALENVMIALELSGAKSPDAGAHAWLSNVGLSGRAHHLPSQLSGGEQQRVALARAMCTDPRILFADEPTGNLDNKTGTEMADLIFSIVKSHGTTLVLVTHESGMARRARRVIEMSEGRLKPVTAA